MSKTKNDPVFKSNILQTPRIRTLTRAKKEEIGAVKAELKSQLAALTSVGVRRHRLPYHESVLRELEEAKFDDSVNILKMLYKKDDDFKKSEKVKKFKNQKHLIERVKIGLINAEVAKKNNEIISQSKYLLNIALFFESMTPEWHWIAHEFYKIALEAASAVPDSDDDGELVNTIKYVYGKFLFSEIKDTRGALKLLKEAANASKGSHWNASRILNTNQKSLFKECNSILHEVLSILAKESQATQANVAVITATEALEKANDSGSELQIVRALFDLASVQMSSGNIKEALQNFLKYLARVKRIPAAGGICDAHRELASVYKSLKDTNSVMKHLELFRETAEASNLLDRLGEAHYCLGEYFLEQKKPASATPHLNAAFETYKSLGMMKEMDKARFLAGISKGEELRTSYLELINKCQQNDSEALRKLLAWKSNRTPFWIDD